MRKERHMDALEGLEVGTDTRSTGTPGRPTVGRIGGWPRVEQVTRRSWVTWSYFGA